MAGIRLQVSRLRVDRRKWLGWGLVCLALAPITASRVHAHGEAADEPFLKVLTTAFYDVSITPTEVNVGERVTVTGTVRVLPTWPFNLNSPEKAYITVTVPGPVFVMSERSVNGDSAPHSIIIEKGGIYQFRMVLIARQPGRWHVHPGIAIEGTGTLLGPGEYVTVNGSAAAFSLPLTLLDGGKIDNLDTYGAQFVWWFPFVGFLVGVAWMLWWTLAHRTITNLAVTIQIPLNDDAPDIGLITPTDHKWCNVMAGVTIVILAAGWIYNVSPYPIRLPQQTVWFAPQQLPPEEKLAEARPIRATYDDGTDTLLLNAEVTNVSSSPITLKQYIMGMATFVNGDEQEQAKAGPSEFVGRVDVEPNTPIEPGAKRELRLRMSSKIFSTVRIVPTHAPQQFVAGLLRFEKEGGGQQMVLLRSNIIPTELGTLTGRGN